MEDKKVAEKRAAVDEKDPKSFDLGKLIELVQEALERLEGTTFVKEVFDGIKSISIIGENPKTPRDIQVLVYGIGNIFEGEKPAGDLNFSYSNTVQQLAFVILLCKLLNIDRKNVVMYDPLCETGLALDIITEYGFHFEASDDGNRIISRPTILFLPNAFKYVYNNLIKKNWTDLTNMVMLGNRLDVLSRPSEQTTSPSQQKDQQGQSEAKSKSPSPKKSRTLSNDPVMKRIQKFSAIGQVRKALNENLVTCLKWEISREESKVFSLSKAFGNMGTSTFSTPSGSSLQC